MKKEDTTHSKYSDVYNLDKYKKDEDESEADYAEIDSSQ
jgi:hypothetical protein